LSRILYGKLLVSIVYFGGDCKYEVIKPYQTLYSKEISRLEI